MKKLFSIVLIALCGSFAAKANTIVDEPDSLSGGDRLSKIEEIAEEVKAKKSHKSDELVSFDVLNRMGWAYLLPIDYDIFSVDRSDSEEIWFNVAQLGINAADWFSIELGADLKWSRFMAAADKYVYIDNLNEFAVASIDTQKALYPAAAGTFKTISSQINLFAIEVPLALDFHFGDFGFRAGASAGFNLKASQKEKVKYADTKVRSKQGGLEVNDFYYTAFAEILYAGIGAYAKYTPVEIIPGAFKSMFAIGLVMDF